MLLRELSEVVSDRVLLKKGEILDISSFSGFFVVKSGLVKVSLLSKDGKEFSIDILSDNDVFPCGGVENEFITAWYDSELIFVPSDEISETGFSPKVYDVLSRKIIEKSGRIKKVLYNFAFLPIEKRIVDAIYYLASVLSNLKYDIGRTAKIIQKEFSTLSENKEKIWVETFLRDENKDDQNERKSRRKEKEKNKTSLEGVGKMAVISKDDDLKFQDDGNRFSKISTIQSRIFVVELEITHEELASFCGATRECVTNALKMLSESGKIKTERRKIVMYITEKELKDE